MAELTYRDAVARGIAQEMARDQDVVFFGEDVAKADAAFVRARTGFAIGGVPPIGHADPPETLLDEDLLRWEEIWAAAGTPNSIFKLTPAQLVAMTQGRVARIAWPRSALR